ncbi:MAG: oligosaccharide flippase family protein [Bacillaceae bacterium]|nr:oligosaccharide flippase family protein [Bacillaceae bacterium]
MTQRHFLYGALILSIAAVISKGLGLIYRIPFQRIAGDDGLAMYQVTYPLFSTLLILIVSGIPIVMSKMISEQAAVGNIAEEKRILRITLILVSMIGFLGFVFLFAGAPYLAEWTGLPEVELSIQTISFALLIIPAIAVLRGYFYGHQMMFPSGSSQVIEQLFRVLAIIFLSFLLVQKGFALPEVVAGATFGTVIGAVFSVLYLFYHYVKFEKGRGREGQVSVATGHVSVTRGDILKKVMIFSAAVSISSLMIPLFGLADSFSVVNLLVQSGITADTARDLFGYYSRGLPFVQVSTVFATALALSIVPKIAAEGRVQNTEEISRSTNLAVKVTILLALPASAGLALLAENLNVILYGDGRGSLAIAVLSLSSLFLTLGITTSAVLQGRGNVYRPAVYLLIALGFKLILNLWWVPVYDITGAAFATLGAYAVLVFLNGWAIKRKIEGFQGWTAMFYRPLLATLVMGLAVFAGGRWGLTVLFSEPTKWQLAFVLAVLISVGAVLYFAVILGTRAITKSELRRIPRIGEPLVKWLTRFRLIS